MELVDEEAEAGHATHALVVLSGGLLRPQGPKMRELAALVGRLPPADIVYVYSVEAGWEFYGAEHMAAPPAVKDSITSHEALVVRTLRYERRAMLEEVLRRLRPIPLGP